ncbi:MAG: GNAT family N-acetyltransferase, partial [Clostridia bacterium]|nr:GNAT family N-acetyltransferase [Clostridia bacterium]
IDCELLALYVKPNLKYKGIGTQLFQFVINEFKSKNKTKMILWCLKDSEPSKKFYTKMGGKIIKERAIEIGEKEYLEVGFEYNI